MSVIRYDVVATVLDQTRSGFITVVEATDFDRVVAERDEARRERDAARYRWLRAPSNDECDVLVPEPNGRAFTSLMGDDLDAAIDAALTTPSEGAR